MLKISVATGKVFDIVGGPDAGFALLKRAGFEGVQFGLSMFGLTATAVRGHKPSVMDAPLGTLLDMLVPYKAAAEKHGIAVTQVHAPFPMWMPDDEPLEIRMKDLTEKSIAIAGFLKSPYCVVHPAGSPIALERQDPEEERAVNLRLYGDLIPTLKKYHVAALMENLFSHGTAAGVEMASGCTEFGEVNDWLDTLNAQAGEELFGFCLDTGHCNLARVNLPRAVRQLGSHLKALHIQDNGGHLDDHRPPYAGTIDWELFLQALADVGYQGDLNFEVGTGSFPPQIAEHFYRMLAQTGQYFRRRLAELEGRG